MGKNTGWSSVSAGQGGSEQPLFMNRPSFEGFLGRGKLAAAFTLLQLLI